VEHGLAADAAAQQGVDGKPERGTADAVDDDIELTAEMLGDSRGLTAVTAIAFDRHGRLLATEYSTGGLLSPPTTPGALVRISRNGHTVTTLPVAGLFQPTGLAVGSHGAVYVSNFGSSTASQLACAAWEEPVVGWE
jgi:hypothetical protein